MIILPAIDIKGGHCVRLSQGKEDQETRYFEDPVEVAKMWADQGAKYLHIIDLDGAFGDSDVNFNIIKKMRETVEIPMEVGGGIRSVEIAEKYINAGIDRVIIGTMAVKEPEKIRELVEKYGQKIAVSVDCKEDKVAVKGWVEETELDVYEFCKELKDMGVKTIIHTDISKDGMLTGPNVDVLKKLQDKIGDNIIAAGGVSSMGDFLALEKLGLYGAITGKALYEGKINMAEIKQF
ncbi:MAG: 1-(5-phosphoribosyl)-5-[(5-phosphoribosylamino)methylideneamino]imidazole-4-carboxamide isomerase [Gallicola sp.]|nr:1-(5-phosphoribosyl)-5-[(5-phosphoribosylamino)methylideneamino]imidazole-4-carboxamide isomerase [Gallicola sp.]